MFFFGWRNRWVGTGHNAVVTDSAGQDWFVYHAIDRNAPFLNEPYGINRRPMLIDRLDWDGGWPTVRHGQWASDGPQRGPETGRTAGHTAAADGAGGPRVGHLDRRFSDEFSGTTLGAGWTWVREDPNATVHSGALRWPTQAADLVGDANTASVLTRAAPSGDYVVETKLTIDLGVDTVRNFQQAGLVVYAGDDDFARLSHVAIWNTRQIEFGREIPYAGRLSYGGMVEGPPADTTWLRLAHTVVGGEHRYRAGWSTDGRNWHWGGVWTFPGGIRRLIDHLATDDRRGGAAAVEVEAVDDAQRPGDVAGLGDAEPETRGAASIGRGQDRPALERSSAVEVRPAAAGLLDDEHRPREIPRVEVGLDDRVGRAFGQQTVHPAVTEVPGPPDIVHERPEPRRRPVRGGQLVELAVQDVRVAEGVDR